MALEEGSGLAGEEMTGGAVFGDGLTGMAFAGVALPSFTLSSFTLLPGGGLLIDDTLPDDGFAGRFVAGWIMDAFVDVLGDKGSTVGMEESVGREGR